MAQNILALLKNLLNDDLLTKISGLLGEKKAGVTSAVAAPCLRSCWGSCKKALSPRGLHPFCRCFKKVNMTAVSWITWRPFRRGFQVNGSHLLGKEPVRLPFRRQSRGDQRPHCLGERHQQNASSSLLGILAPIVMGFLAKR